MALLASILEKLLTKAGVDTKSDAFTELIQKKELATIEVPDDLSTPLNTLLTEQEAKNSPAIKKHFYGNALDPFNNKVGDWLKEHGVEDTTIQTILSDANTYNKVEASIKEIAKAQAAKAGGGKGAAAELEKKINELSAQISQAAKEKQDAINEVTNRYETMLTETEIMQLLSTKELPGVLDKSIETKMARELLNSTLEKKAAQIKKIDGKLKIVAKDDNNLSIFEGGKELDLDTLTNMALADNKFLKVSGGGGGTPPTPPPAGGHKISTAAANAVSSIDTALSGQ